VKGETVTECRCCGSGKKIGEIRRFGQKREPSPRSLKPKGVLRERRAGVTRSKREEKGSGKNTMPPVKKKRVSVEEVKKGTVQNGKNMSPNAWEGGVQKVQGKKRGKKEKTVVRPN